ncbi:MAG: hypothetical protein GY946_27110 [bacterium]|nr:hypothetical protein [bacterium]
MTSVIAVLVFVASGPALINLGEHWIAHAWSRYSLLFAPLLVVAVRSDQHDGSGRAQRWLGAGLIVAALVVQLAAVVVSHVQVGRPALALAVVGLLLLRDIASLRCALLALWVVPVPHPLMNALGGDTSVEWIFESAAALLAPLGFVYEISRHWVVSGASEFHLRTVYLGLPLLVHLLGLGWYACARRSTDFKTTLGILLLLALSAPAIQFFAIVIALLAVQAGHPAIAGPMLETGPWIVTAAIAIFWVEFRATNARA